jgi:hypothetical protein
MNTGITRLLVTGVLSLGLVAPLLADTATLEPGRYEALMLAVTPDHQVEGFYAEELGEGVSRRCAFYFKGQPGGSITTWNRAAYPGQVAATADGVTLTVQKGREHPGCMSVLAPEIATGLELGRIDSRAWIGLVSVSSDKAYLLKAPGSKATKRPYIVKNDVVGVLEYKDGWAKVEYVNADDRSFTGWIRADQYSRLVAPKR